MLVFTFSVIEVMQLAVLVIRDLCSESVVTIDEEVAVHQEFSFFSSLHRVFVESHTSSRLELEFDFIACRMRGSFLEDFVGFFEVFVSFTKPLEAEHVRKSVFFTFF